jgi:hypothetical protein
VPNVLLVALDQMRLLEWLVSWVESRPRATITQAADLQAAAEQVASTAPVLVLAPSQELLHGETFMKTVLEHQHETVLTLIFVHLVAPEYGLILYEYDRGSRAFARRRASLSRLQNEIDAVLERHRVPPEVCEQVRGIGFYDCLQLDGKTLHVQTEVAGRADPRIRTTVHRDGEILSSTSEPWPPGLHDRTAAESLIREHHQQLVTRLRSQHQS